MGNKDILTITRKHELALFHLMNCYILQEYLDKTHLYESPRGYKNHTSLSISVKLHDSQHLTKL